MAGNDYATGYQAYDTETEDEPPTVFSVEDGQGFVHFSSDGPTGECSHCS